MHPLVAAASAPKAIALPPSGGTALAPSFTSADAEELLEDARDMTSEEQTSGDLATTAGALVLMQPPQGTCEADWHLPPQCMQQRQPQRLPGLAVARPMTLPAAVAGAIAEAAYQQGSSDNLAVVAVDLLGAQRSTTEDADTAASMNMLHSRGSSDAALVRAVEPAEGGFSLSVPRRGTAASTSGLLLDGAAQQYELKELLALVPRRAHLQWPGLPPALSLSSAQSEAAQAVLQEGASSLVQACSQAVQLPGERADSGPGAAPVVCWAPHAAEQLQLGPSASQMVARIAAVPLARGAEGTPRDGGGSFGVLAIAQALYSGWASALRALEPGPGGGTGLPYSLDAQFAQGGFGEVWRAERKPGALSSTTCCKTP